MNRVDKALVVERQIITGHASVALVGNDANPGLDGAARRCLEAGQRNLYKRLASDLKKAIGDREVAERFIRVGVGDDERPASGAIASCAGLNVGDRVSTRPGRPNERGNVGEGAVLLGRSLINGAGGNGGRSRCARRS